MTGVEDGD